MAKKDLKVADSLEELFGAMAKTPEKKISAELPESTETKESASLKNAEPFEFEEDPGIVVENPPNQMKSDSLPKTTADRQISSEYIASDGFIQCPPGPTKILFTQKAFEEVIMLAKAINEISKEKWGDLSEKLEVFCYVLTDPTEIQADRPSRISGIYIPFHEASETRVHVSETGLLDVQRYLKKTNKVLLGWAHSHGHFDAYSSGTDEIQHQTILNDTSNFIEIGKFRLKYAYGITVVESGERFGVILSQYPCGHIERTVDEQFDIQGEGFDAETAAARFEEIKNQILERATIVKPSQSMAPEDLIKDLTQELLSEFVGKLRRTKNILFDDFSENIDEQFEQIQVILQRYDNLLIDGAEESFSNIAKKLMKVLKEIKDEH